LLRGREVRILGVVLKELDSELFGLDAGETNIHLPLAKIGEV
jgi:hypothetical protein